MLYVVLGVSVIGPQAIESESKYIIIIIITRVLYVRVVLGVSVIGPRVVEPESKYTSILLLLLLLLLLCL